MIRGRNSLYEAIGLNETNIDNLDRKSKANALRITTLESETAAQQRAIDTLSGNLETYVGDLQDQCDRLSDNVGYLTETKADKRGIYDNMTVGNAKQLLPDSGEVVESRYTKRTTARSASVMSGAAQIASLKGLTVKQLIKNGNFSEGFVSYDSPGWSLNRMTAQQNGSVLSLTHADTTGGLLYTHGAVLSAHKYYFSCKVRASLSSKIDVYASPCAITFINRKNLPANDWTVFSGIAQVQDSTNIYITNVNSSAGETFDFDKSYGVRLIDLTELGLDTVLTTAEQCDEFFGDKYIPYGISSFVPQMHKAVGFQQFDKNTMVINGKGIDEDGNLVDSATDSVAVIPCVKSETGTGKNNGYRVKGRTYRVGWNPFHPDNGSFDKVYGVISGGTNYTDYSANDKGYLYISADNGLINTLVVHLKWSYSDDQFDEIYASSDRCRYKESNVDLSSLGELNGLYNNGQLIADEVDFIKGKLIKRIYRMSVNKNNIVYVAGGETTFNTSRICSFPSYASSVICDGLNLGTYNESLGRNDGDVVNCWRFGNNHRELAYRGTFTDKASFDAWIATLPDEIMVYAVVGYEESGISDLPTIYNCDDFGTEEMVSNVPMGAISTEYYENLKDSLRLLSKQSNEGGGFVTHDALDESLDSKLDKDAVVQEMGESEESVMSQKAVTDAIDTAVSTAEEERDWEMIDRAKIWAQMLNKAGFLVKIKAGETVTFADNTAAKASDSHDTWVWHDISTNLELVENVTEGEKIISVGYINSNNFTSVSFLFRYLSGIKSLLAASDICDLSVMSASFTFRECSSLTKLDLSHWDVRNLQTLRHTFYKCNNLNLQQSGIDDWEITTNCTDLHETFFRCEKTISLNLSKWNTACVGPFNNLFNFMTGLQTLDISSWSTESATSLQNMFANDNSLRYITVGEKFFMTQLALPFNGAANLGLNPDGTSNGWLEHVAAVAPRIREKAGYGTDPDIPLLEEENGEWYLNDNHTRTIQLPTLLYNKNWAQALKAELMFKGYSITNT